MGATGVVTAEEQGIEFFEQRIRPVFVERCYECHNSSDPAEGGLALDYRAALLQGGDSGLTVQPKNPAASRLLKVIRHEIEGQEMQLRSLSGSAGASPSRFGCGQRPR